MSFEDLFIDVADLPRNGYGLVQIIFLGIVYGFFLKQGSGSISDGSELLALIPSISYVVGSVVLPALGALPDAMIILFSGLGDNPQEQLSVGIGTLAGSTIMLLSLSWGLSIMAGRVSLNADGSANYTRPKQPPPGWTKLYPADKWNPTTSGVAPGPQLKVNSAVMLFTVIIYLVVQIAAWTTTGTKAKDAKTDPAVAAKSVNIPSLVGMLLAIVSFIGYMVWNLKSVSRQYVVEEQLEEIQVDALKRGDLSLSAVFEKEIELLSEKVRKENGKLQWVDVKRLRTVLRPFFKRHDANGNGVLCKSEMRDVLHDMGETPSDTLVDEWFAKADIDVNGAIDFNEFVLMTAMYLVGKIDERNKFEADRCLHPGHAPQAGPDDASDVQPKSNDVVRISPDPQRNRSSSEAIHSLVRIDGVDEDNDEGEEEEEEDDEIPDDLRDLPPEEQRRRLWRRAAVKLTVGAIVLLLFSDPMVGVLAEFANRTGIPAFYVSFIVAPLASNFSEIMASFVFAQKKTKKTIDIAFSTLLGAACMNNTLCLGVFLGLVYFRNLFWEFSAETLSVILVELVVGLTVFQKTIRLWQGFFIIALLPLALVFVAVLENVAGLD
ncbi:EF-hand domain-containing protein [Plasmodiophora brassicae]|uniref:EF-hand domain-containing protein n=1 Tax=Plasmodiophora brassicae TaxID=37360 RepID=A0A0G4IYR3_PLABS|nr:hypothetical protein PBRA_001456 [Plasmodiophora brassicae]SPQ94091.1 unnamed protein product [Plasmodiophora brassicae]